MVSIGFSAACSGRKNPDSRLGGERRLRHDRIWEQRRSSLGPDAVVAGSRCGRGTSQIRQKTGGLDWGDGEGGREMRSLKGRGLKIGILKVSGSALAAEICTGPHNRLLRRQHCSSLCSQSEGGEYCGGPARAKNPTKICPRALAIFATWSWPSLCKQSELQCWRRNRRLCGPAQISAARALLPLYKP